MLQWPCEISYGCVLCNIRFERLKLALSLFFLCADTSEKLWHSSFSLADPHQYGTKYIHDNVQQKYPLNAYITSTRK